MIESNEQEVQAILSKLREDGMATVASHPGFPSRENETEWWVLGTLTAVAYHNSETGFWGVHEEFLKILVDKPGAPVR